MDFNKHLFDHKQKAKETEKNNIKCKVKEIKRPATDVGDCNVKLRCNFHVLLKKGNKVKITLRTALVVSLCNSWFGSITKIGKLTLLKFGITNKRQKWKVVKWVMLLGPKRKSIIQSSKSPAYTQVLDA